MVEAVVGGDRNNEGASPFVASQGITMLADPTFLESTSCFSDVPFVRTAAIKSKFS